MSDTLFDHPARVVRDVPVGEWAGRSRRADPPTSREAAASTNAAATESAIRRAFERFGWLTDDELADELAPIHDATVKTARSRMKGRGEVVATGTTRPSHHGRAMTVWALAPAVPVYVTPKTERMRGSRCE